MPDHLYAHIHLALTGPVVVISASKDPKDPAIAYHRLTNIGQAMTLTLRLNAQVVSKGMN